MKLNTYLAIGGLVSMSSLVDASSRSDIFAPLRKTMKSFALSPKEARAFRITTTVLVTAVAVVGWPVIAVSEMWSTGERLLAGRP